MGKVGRATENSSPLIVKLRHRRRDCLPGRTPGPMPRSMRLSWLMAPVGIRISIYSNKRSRFVSTVVVYPSSPFIMTIFGRVAQRYRALLLHKNQTMLSPSRSSQAAFVTVSKPIPNIRQKASEPTREQLTQLIHIVGQTPCRLNCGCSFGLKTWLIRSIDIYFQGPLAVIDPFS